ncbi:Hg(II)-responsive transcriptional regulator [Hydrogenophaga aquatica]
MSNNLDHLSIGAFAEAAGVNVETIRFYQRKGLLAEPQRPYGSIRRYRQVDVARLRFVKTAQKLGFTLDEIGQLLRLEDGAHCHDAAELAGLRLADVRARIADLQRIESVLSRLLQQCHSSSENVSCPLIAVLQGTPVGAAGALDLF